MIATAHLTPLGCTLPDVPTSSGATLPMSIERDVDGIRDEISELWNCIKQFQNVLAALKTSDDAKTKYLVELNEYLKQLQSKVEELGGTPPPVPDRLKDFWGHKN